MSDSSLMEARDRALAVLDKCQAIPADEATCEICVLAEDVLDLVAQLTMPWFMPRPLHGLTVDPEDDARNAYDSRGARDATNPRTTPPRRRKRFYVMRTTSRPGWLFSLCLGPYLVEGCTWWRRKLWIGRRTHA